MVLRGFGHRSLVWNIGCIYISLCFRYFNDFEGLENWYFTCWWPPLFYNLLRFLSRDSMMTLNPCHTKVHTHWMILYPFLIYTHKICMWLHMVEHFYLASMFASSCTFWLNYLTKKIFTPLFIEMIQEIWDTNLKIILVLIQEI